jgi:hypothetical protein
MLIVPCSASTSFASQDTKKYDGRRIRKTYITAVTTSLVERLSISEGPGISERLGKGARRVGGVGL